MHATPSHTDEKSKQTIGRKEKSMPSVFGGKNFFQPKLTVGSSDDHYEKEADAVAEQVMRTPDPIQTESQQGGDTKLNKFSTHRIQPKIVTPVIQAKCSQCEEEVQRKESDNDGGFEAPASVSDAIGAGGSPMDTETRSFMENRFGNDFGDVKIHDDSRAHQSSDDIGALAYTNKNHIVFGEGQYQPQTNSGKQLLAHELTHVLQQQDTRLSTKIQRDDKDQDIQFPVKVPAGLPSNKELDQYAEVLIFGKIMSMDWVPQGKTAEDAYAHPGMIVTYSFPSSFVSKNNGKKTADVPAAINKDYVKLQKDEKKKVDDEINKRYHEGTNIPKDDTIKKGEQGKQDMWNVYRDKVINEKKQLHDLPPEIKKLMGDEGKFEPSDYPRLLRIAEKIKLFSPEDVGVYNMMSLHATDNLDLFERSIDMFLARKKQLQDAMKNNAAATNQPSAPATTGVKKDPASMKEAIEASWDGFDSSSIGTMSESDRYDLAREKTWDVTKAQLEYMKNHPGETVGDFAKSALLMNSKDTFKGIAEDLKEAANGDANGYARAAGGVGAGAKLTGWMMAVGAVIFVLSWLTGIGELATIVAFMTYMLASTLVLSEVESELRIKAASKETDPKKFEEDVTKAGLARANVLITIGLIAVAFAVKFLAKTFFPETVKNVNATIGRFRKQIMLLFDVENAKKVFLQELGTLRKGVAESAKGAKAAALKNAADLEKMTTDEFVDTLEKGGDTFVDESALTKGQKVPWRELAKTPEGRAGIEALKTRVVNALKTSVLDEIDRYVKEQLDALDKLIDNVNLAKDKAAVTKALDDHDQFMSEDSVNKRGQAHEKQVRQDSIDKGINEMREEIKKAEEVRKQNEARAKSVAEMKAKLSKYKILKKYFDMNPKIYESFAAHPEALKLLDEIMDEYKALGKAKKVAKKTVEPSPLTEDQIKASDKINKSVKAANPKKATQKPFNMAKRKDAAYVNEYLDGLYKDAETATTELTDIAEQIANESGGQKSMRPGPKDRGRSVQKINDEYGGDASQLVDLAGGKIVYRSLAALYKGLQVAINKLGGKIISFKDRFVSPQDSGYRDILMNVKMSNGHVAELRLHLEVIDEVADLEHALYEIKRVVAPDAARTAGKVPPEELAIALLIEAKTNALFNKAISKASPNP